MIDDDWRRVGIPRQGQAGRPAGIYGAPGNTPVSRLDLCRRQPTAMQPPRPSLQSDPLRCRGFQKPPTALPMAEFRSGILFCGILPSPSGSLPGADQKWRCVCAQVNSLETSLGERVFPLHPG